MSHQHHHHDEHDDGHNHSHQSQLQGKFRFALLFTGLVFIAEVIGGILSNSLALLSDAAHVLSDCFSLFVSWLAVHLSLRPATNSRTYGYHRIEVFAAFINGVSLLVIAGWIFYQAIHRFMAPEPIKAPQMLIVAIIGFVANMIIVWKLYGESHRNLNVRSAVLHVIGDALSSVAVIVGGVVIYWTEWLPIDPILSCVIGVIILVGAVRVTKESVHILLEGTPKHADAQTVATHLCELESIKDVHDMHIWSLCSNYYALSAHVLMESDTTQTPHEIRQQINDELKIHFGIFHTTIQIEHIGCPRQGQLLCNAPHH